MSQIIKSSLLTDARRKVHDSSVQLESALSRLKDEIEDQFDKTEKVIDHAKTVIKHTKDHPWVAIGVFSTCSFVLGFYAKRLLNAKLE